MLHSMRPEAAAAIVLMEVSDTYTYASKICLSVYEQAEERSLTASSALYRVYHSGDREYVQKLFRDSEKPPVCERCGFGPKTCDQVENSSPNTGTWCEAGRIFALAGDRLYIGK